MGLYKVDLSVLHLIHQGGVLLLEFGHGHRVALSGGKLLAHGDELIVNLLLDSVERVHLHSEGRAGDFGVAVILAGEGHGDIAGLYHELTHLLVHVGDGAAADVTQLGSGE